MLQTKIRCLLLLITTFFLSCVSIHRESDPATEAATRAEIANAMQRHMIAARAVNADEIAAFYILTIVLFLHGDLGDRARLTFRWIRS